MKDGEGLAYWDGFVEQGGVAVAAGPGRASEQDWLRDYVVILSIECSNVPTGPNRT